jgi:hypothetical protein
MKRHNKFIFQVFRVQRGTNSYGNCRQCNILINKGDICGSNHGMRYCQDCYERIFKEKISI